MRNIGAFPQVAMKLIKGFLVGSLQPLDTIDNLLSFHVDFNGSSNLSTLIFSLSNKVVLNLLYPRDIFWQGATPRFVIPSKCPSLLNKIFS
ncbi:unnamed protein product [Cochlearia groenlandica]